ncbi:hypothetical protein GLOIN_2v1787971 [Rhizophagus clarus]|nr:hypothetical protein GLOIN_2v1787971 [Rhizophagus clarus]
MYHILWDECYFPELESFHCDNSIDQNVLREMAKTCKSIKKLRYDRIHFSYSDNSGIIKLIEVQKNLSDVKFGYKKKMDDKLSNKSLEESLIKHANTIKYLRIEWNPVTRFLSYFVNLLSLEIDISYLEREESFYLNNLSLPILKILKINYISSRILANLIENTLGCLYKISVNLDVDGGRKLIQAIYQNCKNLKYLKLKFFICNYSLISEIENLLNNCQLLSELIIDNFDIFDSFRWDRLFKTLIRSSPIGLFKFKFSSNRMIRLEHLKLLFDSWKDKRSMFLKISSSNWMDKSRLEDLIEEYKAEGIIERYIISNRHNCEDDFGWI